MHVPTYVPPHVPTQTKVARHTREDTLASTHCELTQLGATLVDATPDVDLEAGLHYQLRSEYGCTNKREWIAISEDAGPLRHNFVLVRRQRPHVPIMHYAVPPKTPAWELNQRTLIFFRPWVTLEQDASTHVPLASALCVDDDWTATWQAYASGNVLHRSLKQWIQNFRAVHSSMRAGGGADCASAEVVHLPENASAEQLLYKKVNDEARRKPYEGMWGAAPLGASPTSVPLFDDTSEAVKQVAREKKATQMPARSAKSSVPGSQRQVRREQPAQPATAVMKAHAPVRSAVREWWAELRARNPQNKHGTLGPPNARQTEALELITDRMMTEADELQAG